MRFSHRALRGAFLIAIPVLSACSEQPGGISTPPAVLAAPNVTPPDCTGQVSKKNDATAADELQSAGGKFCVPAFGGFGGKIAYPNFNGSGTVKLVLTSNTKNVKHEPNMGSGAPLFYIEFKIGEVAFGSTLKNVGGLTGGAIKAGQPYTAFGEAVIDSQKIVLGPCYAVATKGKYGGVIGGLGSLVEGRSVPSTATGVIEIYLGEAITTKC